MSTALTQEQLITTLQGFKMELRDELASKSDFAELKSSFSDLQASVDRYLKFTEAWHQELTIPKSR